MRLIPLILILCLFPGPPSAMAEAARPYPEGRGLSRMLSASLASRRDSERASDLPNPAAVQKGWLLREVWERFAPSDQPLENAPDLGPEDRSLREIWERFAPSARQPGDRPDSAGVPESPSLAPGRCIGDSAEARAAAISSWPWRQSGYELYFASAVELARSIYGLALATGDVGPEITMERFERGAQGFHYGVEQLCPWAEKLLAGINSFRSAEERRLLDLLFLEGVLAGRGGKIVPGGKIRHVLGAAGGKKRSLAENLAHERLHVLWDEDEAFRKAGLSRWLALSGEEKQRIRLALPGYSPENEAQFLEEWAVREAEKLPAEQRKKLIGL